MCILGKTNAQSTIFRDFKKTEMRAVWITTMGGLDWPHSYSQSERSMQKQQHEFCNILDRLVAAGYNTVLLQTRIRATTIFPSDMEPWAGCLSGFPGTSPGYDALAFAIEECHKRGMKLHAWVVTLPVGKWNKTGCKVLRKTHPELLKKIGDEGFMDPEKSGTATYIARFCQDIARRYDVDGIHLDYIRYPETWGVIKDHDKGRENITRIVTAIHDSVKAIKPWVMMSCSPIGKYADTQRTWSHGWNARDVVCQDAIGWLNDDLMDALFPMMYFRGDNFYPFAIDWKERSGGKIICPGLGIYFMAPNQKDWSLFDITQEMNVLRRYGMGNTLFRNKFFLDDTKGIYEYAKNIFSPMPALQPVMEWCDSTLPQAPQSLSVTQLKSDSVHISWEAPATTDVDGHPLHYNIYGGGTLLAAYYEGVTVTIPKTSITDFAITATDRYGKESKVVHYPDKISKNVHHKAKTDMVLNMLPYYNNTIFLDTYDVTPGQIVEIHSIMGNTQYARIAHRYNDHTYIDITLPPGNYSAYFLNKKGRRHKLGFVSVVP